MGSAEEALVAFANAAARLAEPFANRLHVLAELGMSEASWHDLERRWMAELEARAAAGDRALLDLYARSFAEESEHQRARRKQRAQRTAGAEVVLAARPAAASACIDTTCDAIPAFEPALPFAGERSAPPPPMPEDDATANGNDLDATLALEEGIEGLEPLPFMRVETEGR